MPQYIRIRISIYLEVLFPLSFIINGNFYTFKHFKYDKYSFQQSVYLVYLCSSVCFQVKLQFNRKYPYKSKKLLSFLLRTKENLDALFFIPTSNKNRKNRPNAKRKLNVIFSYRYMFYST